MIFWKDVDRRKIMKNYKKGMQMTTMHWKHALSFSFSFLMFLNIWKIFWKKKSKFGLWDCTVTFHIRKKWNGFWEIATYPPYCVGDLAVLSSHRVWNYLSGHCQLIYHPSSSFSSLNELYAGILYISALNYIWQ